MAVVEAKNLSKIFGKHINQSIEMLDQGKTKEEILKQTGNTVGVNRASFSVEEGEIFVIMGLSGSGKSTLVRLINRLIEPSEGSITIEGEELSTLDKQALRKVRREKLGMVFQQFALFPHRTILQNAAFGLEIQGKDKSEREKKAEESLNMVGLGNYVHQKPGQLSGGMQQRVGLARALANDPKVLLMDEAFSALDPLIRKEMQDELVDIQDSMKKTIIFITHDLDEALRIGDRIALMKDGSIVQIGTPEEILMNPANDYVEKFVEDVDRTKVLTAEHIMKKPETVGVDRGPKVALRQMKEYGVSTIYVVDKRRKLLGYVTADQADEANKDGKTIEDVMVTDLPRIKPDTLLTDLFEPMAEQKAPLTVVDDNDRLIGIIVRGSVIGALAGDDQVLNGNGEVKTNE